MLDWRTAKLPHLYYGGDYNPEQWSEEVWLEDMRLMRKAGVNLVSIGIFSWAVLQPDRNTYDFTWLDKLMNLLADNGIYADLATATASPPAWMALEFPDTLPIDENGVQYSFGGRQQYSPNSSTYREFCARLVRQLAERYKEHPALAMWHINNEYGCHVSRCYSEESAAAFRVWLKQRYGTLDELNARWGTNFWSQKYYSWDQIQPPRKAPTFANPGQQLDYARFMDDSLLECYLNEHRILKEVTPDIPVMTNFMGFFKPLDYFRWAKHADLVTWDSYPEPKGGIPVQPAAAHDLMRSLRGGQPFVLMEQVTSQVNWRRRNPVKRPGVMRLWSYQTLAHGGDGILFFQWRQSAAGAEKFHGAMVSHTGDENSRVYREVEQLGQELRKLDELVDTRIHTKAAILFDWDNWWALELDSKPSRDVLYLEQIMNYYQPLFERNIAIDFVQPDSDLSGYKLVIAPNLYMVKPGVADNLERFVSAGGTLLVGFFSGIVDENDRIHLGGYPAPLRKLLGIQVEEFDPMLPGDTNRLLPSDRSPLTEASCTLWADVIRLEGAEPLACFAEDFFAGSPAITVNRFGQGRAYYVGTQPEARLLAELLDSITSDLGIEAPFQAPAGIEVTCRQAANGQRYWFVLNHLAQPAKVTLPAGQHTDLISGRVLSGEADLPATGVLVLRAGSPV
ncbi:beta-galactosidase [Paenibacillus sp. y28]|uniref:beta-galactosidase n=1 Tax=Paenibacillus sp. y28 TaxID=3129110 RepID=UPI0030185E87